MVAAKVKLRNGRWEAWLGSKLRAIYRIAVFSGPPHRPPAKTPIVETLKRIPVAAVKRLERYPAAREAIKRDNVGVWSLGILPKRR